MVVGNNTRNTSHDIVTVGLALRLLSRRKKHSDGYVKTQHSHNMNMYRIAVATTLETLAHYSSRASYVMLDNSPRNQLCDVFKSVKYIVTSRTRSCKDHIEIVGLLFILPTHEPAKNPGISTHQHYHQTDDSTSDTERPNDSLDDNTKR